jgi:hypothetical protein
VLISRIHNQSLKSLLKPLDYSFTHSFQVVRSDWQCALLSSSTGTSSSVLKMHQGRGGELLFEPTSSNTVFNAAALTIINLTLTTSDTQTPSKYDELIAAVQPLLCGIKIINLRQDSTLQDLTFLSNKHSAVPWALRFQQGSLGIVIWQGVFAGNPKK